MKGKMMIGLLAGGVIGAAAAAMSVPGNRHMLVKRARCLRRKLPRAARQFWPM